MADSWEWLGGTLDTFDPGLWRQLVLFESEVGQGCSRAPSLLLQGGEAGKDG